MSKPTQKEIDEALNKADQQIERGGSKWRGMTYEQGVQAALLWMQGVWADNPMPDK